MRVKTRDTRGSLRARARPRPLVRTDVLLTRDGETRPGKPVPERRASAKINTDTNTFYKEMLRLLKIRFSETESTCKKREKGIASNDASDGEKIAHVGCRISWFPIFRVNAARHASFSRKIQ